MFLNPVTLRCANKLLLCETDNYSSSRASAPSGPHPYFVVFVPALVLGLMMQSVIGVGSISPLTVMTRPLGPTLLVIVPISDAKE
jgi:hypothetical protein